VQMETERCERVGEKVEEGRGRGGAGERESSC